jgi:hypothetical protein
MDHHFTKCLSGINFCINTSQFLLIGWFL